MKTKLHELRRLRAAKVTEAKALAQKEADLPEGEALEEAEANRFVAIETELKALDARIARVEAAINMDADEAKEMDDEGGEGEEKHHEPTIKRSVPAEPRGAKPKADQVVAGAIRMLHRAGGNSLVAAQEAMRELGDRHPVTRALSTGTGPTGGFIVPPDYVAEIIEILTPMTVVRSSNPRNLPMPRGTMTLPRQSGRSTASYGGELSAIPSSNPTLGQIVATYKKLTALVPISNDLIRYSNPAVDAWVREDLTTALALREDLAFIRGDGLADTPKGLRTFGASYSPVSAGVGANFITSTASYTLATAAQELGGAVNKLETSNVRMTRPVWIMNPRSKNYLYNVQNSLGNYVFREEMDRGTLLGHPFKTTTQIPTNLVVGGNSDCSEIYLADMGYAVILDSMTLQIEMSRESSYVDAASGATVSAFQQDQTVMRAIAEHDFQMTQEAAVAVITGVRWAPAIS